MDLMSWVLLALCSIVVLSYLFDVIAQQIRIPSVVLLIVFGILARIVLDYFNFKIPLLNVLLPIIGTLGLILIVLEGALDLSITKDNYGLIGRASLSSILGIMISGGLIAGLLHSIFQIDWRTAWLYATPMAVISSAVAIPAAKSLSTKLREFVIYESSLSDIFGVLLFYSLLSGYGDFGNRAFLSVGNFIVSIGIGVIFAIILYWLINKIEAHVRFVPMIAGIALVYAISKLLHLAPLVIVMVVGLLLNNFLLLRKAPFFAKIYTPEFSEELDIFKHLVAEATFVVRTFFFVLLGYSTQLLDLTNIYVWLLAIAAIAACLIPRAAIIFACNGGKKDLEPLIWFAPKGLITILLILSIPKAEKIEALPGGTVMLLVLISAFLLTYGLMRYKSAEKANIISDQNADTAEPENTAIDLEIKSANDISIQDASQSTIEIKVN